MINWDKRYTKDWDELGFYYEYDENLKQWRFIGSISGLTKLAELIFNYSNNSFKNAISRHEHYGPHDYLKIMTWNEAIITDKYIAGSQKDLRQLSEIIAIKISQSVIGQVFKILSEYSTKSTATLLFVIMADDFLPSSIEDLNG